MAAERAMSMMDRKDSRYGMLRPRSGAAQGSEAPSRGRAGVVR